MSSKYLSRFKEPQHSYVSMVHLSSYFKIVPNQEDIPRNLCFFHGRFGFIEKGGQRLSFLDLADTYKLIVIHPIIRAMIILLRHSEGGCR